MDDKYKQYLKRKEETIHEHKQREKDWHQPELPFYGTTKEEFYSHVSKKYRSLSHDEFDSLFWDHLVHIGWRVDDKDIVLLCQYCELIIFSVPIRTVNTSVDNAIDYLKNPVKRFAQHKKFCKAIPEGEEHE